MHVGLQMVKLLCFGTLHTSCQLLQVLAPDPLQGFDICGRQAAGHVAIYQAAATFTQIMQEV